MGLNELVCGLELYWESSEEGEKRAVGLVEVAGGPQGALRSLEKVFGELVLGAKWVEEGVLRKKLVRESHVKTHEGEFHLFWRLFSGGLPLMNGR